MTPVGSLLGREGPAAAHDVPEVIRAVGLGPVEGHTEADVGHEGAGVDVAVRRLAEGDDLPKDDAEGPDVRLGAELSLGDRLRRHPLHGDLAR